MSDYDFRQFNDKEFEVFCADLLSEVFGQRIERFKAGKDAGIDGRFYSDVDGEVLLQCKHWSNTPIANLLRALDEKEKSKLEKLTPKRYILVISNPLSRLDKKKIFQILSPYIKCESDIYGKEDLNDLLKKFPFIERRHYKLWLHSASVIEHVLNGSLIGRSRFSLDEIIKDSRIYAITSNHEAALSILERLGVVIISGDPGVGKTTLANHLCLKYVADGFDFYKISDEIKEAEAVFDITAKQIFYFDDFLGRNYLDALRGHEGNQVTQFIKRVSVNKNKKFVLTSRSTILNQGKFLIDSFEHNNIDKNEFELRIKSLSEFDKAKILYNHIFHSGMNAEYIEQLYLNRRYRHVISHRNYNPRLISYITDPTRLELCPSDSYWNYVTSSLDNPTQIWENPFEAQLDDFGRALVLLVVIHGYRIPESLLGEVYQRYLALPVNQSLKGRREFLTNLRLLTGSFLNRTVLDVGVSIIDLFNPSIGDYVIKRYSRDVASIRIAMLCLRTSMSLFTFMSLRRENVISIDQAKVICQELIECACNESFEGFDASCVSKLIRICVELFEDSACENTNICTAVNYILNVEYGEISSDSFFSIKWAMEIDLISSDAAAKFIGRHYESVSSDDEIRSLTDLLAVMSVEGNGYSDVISEVNSHVFSLISENLSDFVDTNDAFAKVNFDDVELANEELKRLLQSKLDKLGVRYKGTDISKIINSYDTGYELDAYYQYLDDDYDSKVEGPTDFVTDEIDDLFERE
jgi:adenylate kinase family enzyme